jgi:integrase
MSVTIRYRKVRTGYSMYLDLYQHGKRSYEHSKIIVKNDYSKPLTDAIGQPILDASGKPKYPKWAGDDRIKFELMDKRRLERELQLKNAEYDFRDPATQKLNLLDYAQNCKVSAALINHLKKCFGLRIIFSLVNSSMVRRFIDYLRVSGLAENTQNTLYNYLVATLNRAKRDRILVNNPCDLIGRKEKPKMQEGKREYLTSEEVATLSNCPMPEHDYQAKNAFLFACMTGLRISDVLKLRYSDIEDRQLKYRMQKVSENFHHLPLSDQALQLIADLKQDPRKEYVFWELRHISTPKRLDLLKEWSKKAGIKKHVTWHVARHTCATMLISFGTDIYTVCKILGHSSVKITERYAKIIDQTKSNAVNSLPQFYKA